MDVYSIIYYYDECSNSIDKEHEKYNCICKKKFIKNNNSNETYKEMRNSIINHYEKTKQLEQIYNNYKNYLLKKYKKQKFTYNIFHTVSYGEENNNFTMTNKYFLIAHSKKYVLFFIITPQFNKLNFNDIMFNGIMNKHLLLNSCSTQENYKRYNNKKIITCIFTLDTIQPIFINFNVDNNDNIIKDSIKSYLINEYSSKHNIIYQFYQYYKNNKPIDNKKNKPIDNKKNSIEYTYEKISTYKIPRYIIDYFYDIITDIEKGKKEKQTGKYILDNILSRINDQDLFLNNINKDYLEKSINKYLNIIHNNDYDYDEYNF